MESAEPPVSAQSADSPDGATATLAQPSDAIRRSDVAARVSVVEYTDPICSWAWGTEPKLRLLRWRHGHRLTWRTVMGGLVGDASSGRPDWDPVMAAKPMSAYWRQSSAYTGQPFPFPMRRMARSTDPAGRAVHAARQQGDDAADRVLRRLRESTFVFGETPESRAQFAAAAQGVPGLDVDRWLAALDDEASAVAYRADWEETRRPNDHVRNLSGEWVGIGSLKHSEGHDRYAFPTLVFNGPGGEHTVAGWMPYEAYVQALEAALPGVTSDPVPDPTPAEALARWGVLTAQELSTICRSGAAPRETAPGQWTATSPAVPHVAPALGGPDAGDNSDTGEDLLHGLPSDAVAHFWGAGVVYFTPAEASARRLPTVAPSDAQSLADLAQSFELALRLVTKIPADGWGGTTPCEEWNVRALVNHMVGSTHMVAYGLTARPIGPEFYGSHLGPDPVASYRASIDEVLGLYQDDPSILAQTLQLPWGPITGAELAIMFAADHLVHAWDVARSIGAATDFDHALVARIRAFGDTYATKHRGPEMFDAPTEPPAGANPMDRLAAFVGRIVS